MTAQMARIFFGIRDRTTGMAPPSTYVQRQTPEALALFLNTIYPAQLKVPSGRDALLAALTDIGQLVKGPAP